MKYKIGDLVIRYAPYEDLYDALINREPLKIIDIIDNDEYILESNIYADDTDVIHINIAINNLEVIASKSKKRLRHFRKLQENHNRS